VELPPIPAKNNAAEGWFGGYTWSPDGKWIAGTAYELRDKEVRGRAGIYIYSLETKR
jgi:Tol biopolymer transport system component